MSLQEYKDQLKDYAKDIRLNLETVFSEEGTAGLTAEQIRSIALACAYATKSRKLSEALLNDPEFSMQPISVEAAKAAATIMAMNNVYYRFTHLVEDEELAKLPAKLRMNVIGKPGVAKVDFELMSLAVSAINGCGKCMKSHVQELKKAALDPIAIQTAVRIASVMNAAAQAELIS